MSENIYDSLINDAINLTKPLKVLSKEPAFGILVHDPCIGFATHDEKENIVCEPVFSVNLDFYSYQLYTTMLGNRHTIQIPKMVNPTEVNEVFAEYCNKHIDEILGEIARGLRAKAKNHLSLKLDSLKNDIEKRSQALNGERDNIENLKKQLDELQEELKSS